MVVGLGISGCHQQYVHRHNAEPPQELEGPAATRLEIGREKVCYVWLARGKSTPSFFPGHRCKWLEVERVEVRVLFFMFFFFDVLLAGWDSSWEEEDIFIQKKHERLVASCIPYIIILLYLDLVVNIILVNSCNFWVKITASFPKSSPTVTPRVPIND